MTAAVHVMSVRKSALFLPNLQSGIVQTTSYSCAHWGEGGGGGAETLGLPWMLSVLVYRKCTLLYKNNTGAKLKFRIIPNNRNILWAYSTQQWFLEIGQKELEGAIGCQLTV